MEAEEIRREPQEAEVLKRAGDNVSTLHTTFEGNFLKKRAFEQFCSTPRVLGGMDN
jgi:hypothetical protein